jgi:hypothetical protein
MKKILAIALLLFALKLTVYGQISAYGLFGYWPFSGNANDYGVNGNHGTITGAVLTEDRFGTPESAYYFNGSSFIDLGDIRPASVNNFSVSMWFYATANSNAPCLIQNGIKDQGFSLYLASNGYISFFVSKSTDEGSNSTNFPGGFNLLNTWHNIVCMSDMGKISVYLDGIQAATINGILGADGTNHLKLGYDQTANSHWFKGALDDVRIYNRILTDQEISSLYYENICQHSITVTDILTINVDLLSFDPVIFKYSIKVYPNPTNNSIIIDCGNNFGEISNYKIKIASLTGQTIYEQHITDQFTELNLNNWLGKGVYIIHLVDSNSKIVQSKKIILQ